MNAQVKENMLPVMYRVEDYQSEIPGVYTMSLRTVNGGEGLAFLPGQFTMLYQFGMGEVPISISGDPDRPDTLVHTIRAVGPITEAIKGLRKGDEIGVRGPFGKPWPVNVAYGKGVVVMAGGLGLAPLRPVIYELMNHREKFGRVAILYGARQPSEILYYEQLQAWSARLDVEVHVTVDKADANWRGNVGAVPHLVKRLDLHSNTTTAFVCGPEIMMRFGVLALNQAGLGMGDIYLSTERNMKCGVGLCGHCQWGQYFVCKDGPVFKADEMEDIFTVREL